MLACLLIWTSLNALGSCHYYLTPYGIDRYLTYPHVCLLTSPNALGSCCYQLRSCSREGNKWIRKETNYINIYCPVGNKGTMTTNVYPSVSSDAHSASSKQDITNISLSNMETTLSRGNLLGAVRPHWTRVTESEQRIAWLKKMIAKKLVVRDLNTYVKSISAKLRSEECKIREEEREILMGIMRLKLKDEMKNLIALKRKKDEMRLWLCQQIGKGGRLDRMLLKLRRDMIKIKAKMKKKYKAKLEHLEAERIKEIELKRQQIVIPDELLEFKDISIYDEIKRQNIKKDNIEGVVVGKVSLDADELSILKLSPNWKMKVSKETLKLLSQR